MSPADVETYTSEVGELIQAASQASVESDILPYEAGQSPAVAEGKQTFFLGLSWTEPMLQQEKGWKAILMGFELALAAIYPGHAIIKMETKIDTTKAKTQTKIQPWKLFPIVLFQMYAKMRRTIRGDLTFLDVDVVANKHCDPYKDNDFDVGLTDTAERWPMMPFNAGVMFSKDTPGAQLFWDTVMAYASKYPQNSDTWYNGQLALSHAYLTLKDKIKIKIFPHDEYNYVPEVYEPTDAYYVHLKGNRKQFHQDYVLPVLNGKQGRLYVPPQKEVPKSKEIIRL